MKLATPYARMIPLVGTWIETVKVDEQLGCGRESETFTLDMGVSLLKHVEWCSRISHRSEEAVTSDSWRRILKSVVIDHGDWSVTEHASVSVDAYVDRGITHEWVRHRIGAYTQESTRFVNYEKKMPPSFMYPEALDETTQRGDPNRSPNDNRDVAQLTWKRVIEVCEDGYRELLRAGYPPQIARSLFPNALASRLIVTYNLRSWRHFFIMRTCAEAHPQMRQVTIPLLREFQSKIPLLYDDIEPMQKQSEAMKKAR